MNAVSALFTVILSIKLHLPFLLITLFKTFHIFLKLSLLFSIFLCNNQTSVFSEYNRLCYINVGRLVEDTWSLFCWPYVTVNSNWVHPPRATPGDQLKKLARGVGIRLLKVARGPGIRQGPGLCRK